MTKNFGLFIFILFLLFALAWMCGCSRDRKAPKPECPVEVQQVTVTERVAQECPPPPICAVSDCSNFIDQLERAKVESDYWEQKYLNYQCEDVD